MASNNNYVNKAEFSEVKTTVTLNQKFMEEKFEKMEVDMKTWFWEIKTQLVALNKSMEDQFKWLDNKYASKQTEKIVYWVVAAILTTFVTALTYYVMNFQWK